MADSQHYSPDKPTTKSRQSAKAIPKANSQHYSPGRPTTKYRQSAKTIPKANSQHIPSTTRPTTSD